MNRRVFLGRTAAALAALALRPTISFASTPGSGKRLVFLNLIGGFDGYGAVSEVSGVTADYFRSTLRPDLYPDIDEIMQFSGENVGLHMAFSGLHQDVAAGRIRLLLNSGILQSNPGASHSECQKIWEKGDIDLNLDGAVGWIGKAMDAYDMVTGQVIGIGSGQKESFIRGEADGESIIVANRLRDYQRANRNFGIFEMPRHLCDSNNYSCSDYKSRYYEDDVYLRQIKERLGGPEPEVGVAAEYADAIKNVDSNIQLVQSMSGMSLVGDYSLPNSTSVSRFGTHCQDLARAIKFSAQDSSLCDLTQIYYLQRGGWDHHSSYNQKYVPMLQDISAGLYGLIQDLKDIGEWENTAILAFSEFGRTLRQNGPSGSTTAGLDHGRSNNLFILGGAVNGGVAGELNTLSQLQSSNRGMPSTDERRIKYEMLQWAGLDPAMVFSPLVDQQSLGIF